MQEGMVQVLISREQAEKMADAYDQFAETLKDVLPDYGQYKRMESKLEMVLIHGYHDMLERVDEWKKKTPADGTAGESKENV